MLLKSYRASICGVRSIPSLRAWKIWVHIRIPGMGSRVWIVEQQWFRRVIDHGHEIHDNLLEILANPRIML